MPEDIFNDALSMPPGQWPGFLASACQGDKALCAAVASLLGIAQEHPELLEFADHQAIPASIAGYTVLEKCGSGGMGSVYKALDRQLDRIVALKVLAMPRLQAVDPDKWFRDAHARLEQEARYLASLKHSNVATIYSLQHQDGRPCLVMEYVDGRSLAKALEEGDLDFHQRLRICHEAAQGMVAAHESGIIHRDMKPANVMVTTAGAAKILDFGIAKVLEISEGPAQADPAGSAGPARATTKAGTPGYMSPEQIRGGTVDHRADLWAFGCLLRDCFGDGGGWASAKGRLERLADWCCQEDPEQRPGSMAVVCSKLKRILRIHQVSSRWTRWGWPAAGVLLIAGLAYGFLRPIHLLVEARPAGKGVEILYSNGEAKVLVCPGPVAQEIDGAMVVSYGP